MEKYLNPDDKHGILVSILMIVIGLILTIWPGFAMTTVLRLIGAGLLIGGIASIVSWCRKRSNVLTLAEGILMTLGGIVVLAAPRFLISIVPTIVGILVLINGIINLAQALDQRRSGYNRWLVSLAMAILTIVLGLVVLFNPFSTVKLLVMGIGIIIVYNGISNLWIESRYKKI